ncbi:MAG TPA: S8 family serine peptidase [Thermoanaerobaculia bacterium]
MPAARRERDALFQRFRRDLTTLEPLTAASGKMALEPVIRHEYATVFQGAAVKLPAATAEKLRELPYVRAVHDDVRVRKFSGAIATTDARGRVHAEPLGSRGRGIVVAVIDTGIDYTHPALGGGFGAGRKVAGGWDFVNDDADPMDDEGHGTHVAGIVAADSPELIGVAPEATLLAYKVLDANGNGDMSDIIAAIERAVDPNGDGNVSDRAHVLNLSLGGSGDAASPVSIAVDHAVAAGATVVVAAGNSGATLTIGAPAAARRAITVAASDETDHVAFFSSKGPTQQFEFKPDVVAPGNLIVSAKRGGGTVALSGTSMSAPHVAGAAALLLELHPEWTPERVKGTLVATARPLPDDNPWARGAGKIDVTAAASASLLSDTSGISFGLNSASGGTFSESRTVRLTNASAAEQLVKITAKSDEPAVTIAASAAQVTIAPGATADVTITASVDNARLGFPDSLSAFGTITFSGAATMQMPWALFRATRTTVHFDRADGEGFELLLQATNPRRSEISAKTRETATSIDIVAPADTYEVLLLGLRAPEANALPTEARLLVKSRFSATGEQSLDFRGIKQQKIVLNALDPSGRPFSELPFVRGQRHRYTIMAFERIYRNGNDSSEMSYSFTTRDLRTIHVSAAPANEYFMSHSEAYLDLEERRAYVVQHPRMSFNEERTLTSNPAEYLRAVTAPRPGLRDRSAALCTTDLWGFTYSRQCIGSDSLPEGATFEVFTHPAPSTRGFSAPSVMFGNAHMPPLRAINGSIVATSAMSAPPAPRAVPNHGTITVGGGPVFPLCVFGGRCSMETAGVFGPWQDEHAYAAADITWRVFDGTGAEVAAGAIGTQPEPELQAGSRAEVAFGGLRAGDRMTRGALEIVLGTDANDLTPPAMTSLSLRNSAGAVTDVVANNDRATLSFSAGDFKYEGFRAVNGALRETPAVAFRVHGTIAWTPLVATKTGTDAATTRLPLGDLFEVQLDAATAVANTLVDLRFTLADASGNRFVWTQEGAFTVGELAPPPSTGPRRRAVRK